MSYRAHVFIFASALCVPSSALAQSEGQPSTGESASPDSQPIAIDTTAPRHEPLVLAPMRVPTVDFQALRDGSEPVRVEPRPLTPSEQDVIIRRSRLLRLTIGNLAGFGGLVLGSGLTAGAITLPLIACGFSCAGGSAVSIGLGLSFSIATTFLSPAAFVFGASRQGVRGSYWATFGGFWLGLVAGGLLTGASAAVGLVAVEVTSVLSVLLPFLGMSIGHELSAVAVREDEPQAQRVGILRGFPTFALSDRGANVGWYAQF